LGPLEEWRHLVIFLTTLSAKKLRVEIKNKNGLIIKVTACFRLCFLAEKLGREIARWRHASTSLCISKYRPGWVAPTPQVLLPAFLKLKIELHKGFNYHKHSIH
jgi:hypothetical protein